MEAVYDLGTKMIDSLSKEKVQSGYVMKAIFFLLFLSLLSFFSVLFSSSFSMCCFFCRCCGMYLLVCSLLNTVTSSPSTRHPARSPSWDARSLAHTIMTPWAPWYDPCFCHYGIGTGVAGVHRVFRVHVRVRAYVRVLV